MGDRPENPFLSSYPYARERYIGRALDRIGGNIRQGALHYALLGAPRMGKTTVLREIVAQGKSDEVWVYFPCRSDFNSRAEVFQALSREIVRVLTANSYTVDWLTGVDAIQPTLQDGDTAKKGLSELVHQCTERNIQLVLVLDDFDALVKPLADYDVSFLRELVTWTKVGLIVSICRPLSEVLPTKSVPSPQMIFEQEPLGPFSLDEADHYLETHSDRAFSQNIKDWIIHQAGPHPCFLQKTAEFVWDELQKDNNPLDHEPDLIRQLRNLLEKDFLEIWQAMDEYHQNTLYLTAKGQGKIDMPTLQDLETYYGVLWRNEQSQYAIMGDLFKTFVIAQTQTREQRVESTIYELGERTLSQIPSGIRNFVGSPRAAYWNAFKAFATDEDYVIASQHLATTLNRLLNARVMAIEQDSAKLFSGKSLVQKIDFIQKGFQIPETWKPALIELCQMLLSEEGGKYANRHEVLFRFYLLSGLAQYLLDARLRQNWQNAEYEIVEEVTSTQRNTIYKARQASTEQIVAIKCPHDPGATDRLGEQARILGMLSNNRNIVGLIGRVNRPLGVVMQWVDGTTLEQQIKDGVLFSPQQTADIARKIATALKDMHARQIIHWDIKPNNILLDNNNEPVLIDFDIASRLNGPNFRSATSFEGTRLYSAPEQLREDRARMGFSSDIFALGVVMYEMMTQKLPFPYGNTLEPYGGYLPSPPQSVVSGQRDIQIPDSLYNIVCLMLDGEPEKRPRDGAALCELLDSELEL